MGNAAKTKRNFRRKRKMDDRRMIWNDLFESLKLCLAYMDPEDQKRMADAMSEKPANKYKMLRAIMEHDLGTPDQP